MDVKALYERLQLTIKNIQEIYYGDDNDDDAGAFDSLQAHQASTSLQEDRGDQETTFRKRKDPSNGLRRNPTPTNRYKPL